LVCTYLYTNGEIILKPLIGKLAPINTNFGKYSFYFIIFYNFVTITPIIPLGFNPNLLYCSLYNLLYYAYIVYIHCSKILFRSDVCRYLRTQLIISCHILHRISNTVTHPSQPTRIGIIIYVICIQCKLLSSIDRLTGNASIISVDGGCGPVVVIILYIIIIIVVCPVDGGALYLPWIHFSDCLQMDVAVPLGFSGPW